MTSRDTVVVTVAVAVVVPADERDPARTVERAIRYGIEARGLTVAALDVHDDPDALFDPDDDATRVLDAWRT